VFEGHRNRGYATGEMHTESIGNSRSHRIEWQAFNPLMWLSFYCCSSCEKVTCMNRTSRPELPSHMRPLCLPGPNLAKSAFLANESRSEVKSSEESGRHAYEQAQNGAQGGRKVRIMHRQRSFEYTGGVNRGKNAVASRQNALSNGKSELLVHASNPLRGRSGSTWPNFGASLG
jgi:hypothetical protein